VSCDREERPGLGYQPQAGEKEDRKRNPEQLKPINRNEVAQYGVASLKDAQHFQIDEPEKFRTRRVLKSMRSQFGAQRGGKERQGSQKLQFKKTVHWTTSHTSKRAA